MRLFKEKVFKLHILQVSELGDASLSWVSTKFLF